jgi:hypothetical protein
MVTTWRLMTSLTRMAFPLAVVRVALGADRDGNATASAQEFNRLMIDARPGLRHGLPS